MTDAVGELRRTAGAAARVARQQVVRAPLSPTRFVIFGRGRSGSTTLVSLLDALPEVHCEGEILTRAVLFPRSYVRARCAASGSPVYGCKILGYQIRTVQPLLRRAGFIRRLHEDGFRVIYLTRENLVEHAVSNVRARQFGFHSQAGALDTPAKIVLDRAELMAWIHSSELASQFESAALTDVPHLALTYERDLATEAEHRRTLLRVCEFLRLPTDDLAPARSAYRKVSPRALSDSIANYDEVVDLLSGTPYERYLH